MSFPDDRALSWSGRWHIRKPGREPRDSFGGDVPTLCDRWAYSSLERLCDHHEVIAADPNTPLCKQCIARQEPSEDKDI